MKEANDVEPGQHDAATGAPQDATPPAPTDSAAVPAQPQPATPEGTAPTPPTGSDAEKELRQTLQERESTIGRQGAHLDTLSRENEALREQLAQGQGPAEPAAPQPPASYDDLLLSERPGAAFDQFRADYDPHRDARAEQIAEQKANEAVQRLQMKLEFDRIAPDLIGNEVAVEQASRDLGDTLRTMEPGAALQAIATRAREKLQANVSQEAAPTPPPVAPATAPPQAPQAPGGDVPQPVDYHKAARADAAALKKRQQRQTAVPPLTPE